ncbi:hypothetical protein [Streptomyces sp. NPDC127112]|uniref:hypothetical protein n=1 Tax=Streptomyces sp. NPDC127112 TaxID=3345364 RepID=UPI00363E3613
MSAVEIITAVFGAGGIASVTALVKVMSARKDGFNKARAQHIDDLAQWRSELQNTVNELQELVEFYRHMSADYAFQLREHGIDPKTTAVKPEKSGN